MKRKRAIEFAASPERALAASRRALAELGWEIVEEDESRLVALEVPFRLSCLARPTEAEVAVGHTSPQRSTVILVGSSRGVGAGPRIEAQMRSIEARMRALL